jgi:hypothetical protein
MNYDQKGDTEVIEESRAKVDRFEKWRWVWTLALIATVALLMFLVLYSVESAIVCIFLASIFIPNYLGDLDQHRLNKRILSLFQKEGNIPDEQK